MNWGFSGRASAIAALLMLAAAGPAFAAGGCAEGCQEAEVMVQPMAGRQSTIEAATAAQCEQMMKDDRLALALLGMCHFMATPSDRLCFEYASACQRLRAAGCNVDWACY
jgi:hypothetical protein